MSRTRVKLLYKGFNELRKSPEMQAAIQAEAQRIAAAAGSGYEMHVRGTRAYVSTATDEATYENLKTNRLLKVVTK